jgi:hypothetical protein
VADHVGAIERKPAPSPPTSPRLRARPLRP